MDHIKGLPLAPHRCRSAPHQLPLATAVCSHWATAFLSLHSHRPIADSTRLSFVILVLSYHAIWQFCNEKLQKYEFHNLCIISLSITCMSTTRNQRIHFSPNNIKIYCAVLPIDIIYEVKSMITGDGNTIRNIKWLQGGKDITTCCFVQGLEAQSILLDADIGAVSNALR